MCLLNYTLTIYINQGVVKVTCYFLLVAMSSSKIYIVCIISAVATFRCFMSVRSNQRHTCLKKNVIFQKKLPKRQNIPQTGANSVFSAFLALDLKHL